MAYFEVRSGKPYIFGVEVPENGVINVTYPNGSEGTVKVTPDGNGSYSIALGRRANIFEQSNPLYYGVHGGEYVEMTPERLNNTNFEDSIHVGENGDVYVSRLSFDNNEHCTSTKLKVGNTVEYNGRRYQVKSIEDGKVVLQAEHSVDTVEFPVESENSVLKNTAATGSVSTTAPPASTTAPPASTTAPPASTTAPPASTTAPPVSTTAPGGPVSTTAPGSVNSTVPSTGHYITRVDDDYADHTGDPAYEVTVQSDGASFQNQPDHATQDFVDNYGNTVAAGEGINWATTTYKPYNIGKISLSEVGDRATRHGLRASQNRTVYSYKNNGEPENLLQWKFATTVDGQYSMKDAYYAANFRNNEDEAASYRLNFSDEKYNFTVATQTYSSGEIAFDCDYDDDINNVKNFYADVQQNLYRYAEDHKAKLDVVIKNVEGFDELSIESFSAGGSADYLAILHDIKGFLDVDMQNLVDGYAKELIAIDLLTGNFDPSKIPEGMKLDMEFDFNDPDIKDVLASPGDLQTKIDEQNTLYKQAIVDRDAKKLELDQKKQERDNCENRVNNIISQEPPATSTHYVDAYGHETSDLTKAVSSYEAPSEQHIQWEQQLGMAKAELEKLKKEYNALDKEYQKLCKDVLQKKRTVGKLILVHQSLKDSVMKYDRHLDSSYAAYTDSSSQLYKYLHNEQGEFDLTKAVSNHTAIIDELHNHEKFPVITNMSDYEKDDYVNYNDGDGRNYKVVEPWNPLEGCLKIACVDANGNIVGQVISVWDQREIARVKKSTDPDTPVPPTPNTPRPDRPVPPTEGPGGPASTTAPPGGPESTTAPPASTTSPPKSTTAPPASTTAPPGGSVSTTAPSSDTLAPYNPVVFEGETDTGDYNPYRASSTPGSIHTGLDELYSPNSSSSQSSAGLGALAGLAAGAAGLGLTGLISDKKEKDEEKEEVSNEEVQTEENKENDENNETEMNVTESTETESSTSSTTPQMF